MPDAAVVTRLLTGSFTPFLLPTWGEEERSAVKHWLSGESFVDSVQFLERTITRELGDGWTMRLLNLGRSAIQLALESMRLPADCEVLLPSYACLGVVVPVVQTGLSPVFVDVDDQFNVSFESVLEASSERVGAIILPHLSGCWARDTERIMEWARSRGIYVIEDCTQAQGLYHEGKQAGTFGDVGVFSSHGGKMILSSGGGWLISRHPKLTQFLESRPTAEESRPAVAERLGAFLRTYGSSKTRLGRDRLRSQVATKLRPLHGLAPAKGATVLPFNLHTMSDIEAHLLLLQWGRVTAMARRRGENALRWRDLLTRLNFSGLQLLPDEDNVHVKMLLAFTGRDAGEESRILKTALWANCVEGESSYTPLHMRPPFDAVRRTSMPVTERLWRGAFSVPVRPNLGPDDWKRIDRALRSINRFRSGVIA